MSIVNVVSLKSKAFCKWLCIIVSYVSSSFLTVMTYMYDVIVYLLILSCNLL